MLPSVPLIVLASLVPQQPLKLISVSQKSLVSFINWNFSGVYKLEFSGLTNLNFSGFTNWNFSGFTNWNFRGFTNLNISFIYKLVLSTQLTNGNIFSGFKTLSKDFLIRLKLKYA